jgi:hypothetical protein
MEKIKLGMALLCIAVAFSAFLATSYIKQLQIDELEANHDTELSKAQSQIDNMRSEIDAKTLEAMNLTYTIALKEARILQLQEQAEIDGTQIMKLQAEIIKLEEDAQMLAESLANKTEEAKSYMNLAKQYYAQLQTVQTQLAQKTRDIQTLQEEIDFLKKPQLMIVDLKTDIFIRFWFWDPSSHVTLRGYIVNLNPEAANIDSSLKLHVYGAIGTTTIINDYHPLPVIQGNDWIRIDYEVPFAGSVSPTRCDVNLERA